MKTMGYRHSDESDASTQEHPIPSNGIGCFKDRLKSLIQGVSLRGFSRKCGLSEATLRSYLSGETYPTLDRLDMIARAGKVSPMELAFGEGKQQKHASVEAESFEFVPVWDVQVSAGYGTASDGETAETHIAFRRDWLQLKGLRPSSLACVYARGDSMEPLICNDNLLLVDRARTKVEEGIYVLRVDDSLFVKRLQRQMNGSVQILSENPTYKEQVVSKAELNTLHVIGRVVWIARDI